MKSTLLFYGIVSISVFLLPSCGGNSASSDPDGGEATVAENKKMTADEMGAAVSSLYVSAMGDLNAMLQDGPTATEAEPKVAALKEEYIQKLVEYGKKRDELGEDERSKMDLAIRLGLNDAYRDQVYTTYSEVVNSYSENMEFRNLLTSFNILTQYANFELLKQQEPDEARRLGIE